MASERNVWFRVGYALERARARGTSGGVVETTSSDPAAAPAVAAPAEATPRGEVSPLVEKALAAAVVAGGGALVTAALRAWRPRATPGPLALARAGAAGAGAAVARMVIQRMLDLDGAPAAEADPLAPVLAGAARGLVYASVVEPRIPGPPVFRGAVYGGLEFGASPWGGLEGLLDTLPPHRRVPFLAALLDARDDDPTLAGHLLFGVLLAALYGRGPSRHDLWRRTAASARSTGCSTTSGHQSRRPFLPPARPRTPRSPSSPAGCVAPSSSGSVE